MTTNLAQSKHCTRHGCIGIGSWVPTLVIRMVGQTAVETPITCLIPIRLCEKCKKEFEPGSALTFAGKAQLAVQVAMRRGRKLNWDTLDVKWDKIDEPRIIVNEQMR